jgi:hypothetical protein
VSIWQTIKNAFIPWNLIRSENAEHDGVRTVDYGQLLIDGTTGDISDMARVIEREHAFTTETRRPDLDQRESPDQRN